MLRKIKKSRKRKETAEKRKVRALDLNPGLNPSRSPDPDLDLVVVVVVTGKRKAGAIGRAPATVAVTGTVIVNLNAVLDPDQVQDRV